MKKTVLLILSLFCLTSCDYTDGKLVLQNLSMDTVFFMVRADTILRPIDKPMYYKQNKNFRYGYEGCLLPQEKENDHVLNTTWEDEINETWDKKAKVWFFKKQDLDNFKWDSIIKNQTFTKRREFTIENLEEMNWLVIYTDKTSISLPIVSEKTKTSN